jgi:hypothetical protein
MLSCISFGLLAYFSHSSSDIAHAWISLIISVSSNCIHSLDHICITDGIWCRSFSLIRFATAAFFTSISFASLTHVPSTVFNNL